MRTSTLYDFPSFATLNGYVRAIQSAYDAGVDLNDVEAAALSFACGVAVADGLLQRRLRHLGPGQHADALLHKFGFYADGHVRGTVRPSRISCCRRT